MRKLITTVVFGAVALLGADLAYGQTLHRSWEITGYGGVRAYDDDVVFLDSGFVFGGKLAWFPHANIGVEATISTSNADVKLDAIQDSLQTGDDRLLGGNQPIPSDVDVFEFRIDAVYQFLYGAEQRVVPYFSAGVGQFVFDSDTATFDEPATTFNYGGGLKFYVARHIAIRVDVRDNLAMVDRDVGAGGPLVARQTKTFQANNPEFTAGLTFSLGGSDEGFGSKDTDLDGVPDKDDLCPNTPRGVIVDETGCPIDSDNDGVPDGLDACPNTPAGAMVDERGCPLDSDNDGVYDGLDRCPNTPAGVQVDETGCPIEEPEETACIDDQSWYVNDETINVDGKNWVRFGDMMSVPMDQLTQIGEHDGVPVYVSSDAERPYRETLMPLCSPDNTYQPYRLESEVRGTTGFIRSAN